jgi:nitroreductase
MRQRIMDAIECILARNSVRKFKPDPVPHETLKEVFEAALRSPSYRNSQPWSVVVVSGKKKEELTRLLSDLIEKNTPLRPDIPEPKSWPQPILDRMRAAGARRNQVLGTDATIEPSVMLKKTKLTNWGFYGAPHGIFLFQDFDLPLWSLFDIGCFAQTLMLAAKAKGLGTVPKAFLTDYSPDVKKFLGVPETMRLVLGISIGYPDPADKAALFRSDRMPVDEVVRWVK